MKQKKPELLAPAGNMEKLKMAILYGADAVYLGGENFGLRAQGGNFSKQEVDESIPFQGWGDIEHETLGQRRLQNVEARLTLLLPLRKSLKDACAFDQQMKKSK